MKDQENLDRLLADISFRSKELLRHSDHYKVNITNWHEAWRYAYRGEEEIRQLAFKFHEVMKLVLDLRVKDVGNATPEQAGYLARKLLRDYLGLTDSFYQEIYAALGETILLEDSEEAKVLAASLVTRLNAIESLAPQSQQKELEVLDFVSATLAFRAAPNAERQRSFIDALKTLLASRIEKTSVSLELVNELVSS